MNATTDRNGRTLAVGDRIRATAGDSPPEGSVGTILQLDVPGAKGGTRVLWDRPRGCTYPHLITIGDTGTYDRVDEPARTVGVTADGNGWVIDGRVLAL